MPQVEAHIKPRIDPDLPDWFHGGIIRAISADDNSVMCGILSTLNSLHLAFISVSIADHDGSRVLPAANIS